LIATSSIAAFIGLASALKASNTPGRVRLLGTPAEEYGGGKCKLIDAGAYRDVDACLMVHPTTGMAIGKASATTCQLCGCVPTVTKYAGQAYTNFLAYDQFNAHSTGRPAHAALAPFQGLNALDAVVLAYNGVSMLRQQTRPTDRLHSVILEGGTMPNTITASATTQYYVRSTTSSEVSALKDRVVACLEGAAHATGTTLAIEPLNQYADMRPNKTICTLYTDAMRESSSPVLNEPDTAEAGLGSTDQGNVSYEVPAFHGVYAIPCPDGVFNHMPGFTECAGTDEAYKATIVCAKGLAVVGWRILAEDTIAEAMRREFERDVRGKVIDY
jgi:amidohydrolase